VTQPARQLAEGLVRLGTPIVNWYLVADADGVVVVDAAVSGYRPQLEPGLALLGRSLSDVHAVLLTHSDADHTGVAGALHFEHGIPVYIHAEDEPRLRKPGSKQTDGSLRPHLLHAPLWRLFGHLARNGGLKPPKIADAALVDDGQALKLPGRPRVIHAPGHTVGHVAYEFSSHRALILGDVLCTWNPLTTRTGPQVMPSAFNVSTPQALASLARIEDVDAAFVLPGHGDPWTEGVGAAVERARAASPS
jgi:glyoxylase-like metal-dependent hydrolase (beta-lactamase superfamily II)